MIPILALMVAAASPPAPVGQWIVVADAPDGTASYDNGSIERDGSLIRVWVRWDRSRDANASFGEGRLFGEIDCANRLTRMLRAETYERDGTLLGRLDQPEEPHPFGPGPASLVAERLCTDGATGDPHVRTPGN